MKKNLCLLVMCMPIILMAQNATTALSIPSGGIKWINGLSWAQVKQKAKQENKYIFLDCFTTWCGPCKKMEKEVYPNDTLGAFMNEKFISVKVQMDKTAKDDESIKSWYDEAIAMQKQFRVSGYPTYVFLSPEGIWVHKTTGYKLAKEFMKDAQTALQPGLTYQDPNEDLFRLLDEYEKGVKNYSTMPYIIKKSKRIGGIDPRLLREMKKDYKEYLAKQTKANIYTRENLEFLISVYVPSTSILFKYFLEDEKEIDAVMNKCGFSKKVIDNTIQNEFVTPFFDRNNFVPVMIMGNTTDTTAEADWDKLYNAIGKKFSKAIAERNVLTAKVIWYDQHHNFPTFAKYYLSYLDKYGIDTIDIRDNIYRSPGWINDHMWPIFMYVTDNGLLKAAANHMKAVLDVTSSDPSYPNYVDTYANLLHKLGKTKQAIYWEQKALQFVRSGVKDGQIGYVDLIKVFEETLERMVKRLPTWGLE